MPAGEDMLPNRCHINRLKASRAQLRRIGRALVSIRRRHRKFLCELGPGEILHPLAPPIGLGRGADLFNLPNAVVLMAALYVGALLILFLTPGPVWVALTARALSGGFHAAWPLAFGVVVGDVLWPLLAILGALVASATAPSKSQARWAPRSLTVTCRWSTRNLQCWPEARAPAPLRPSKTRQQPTNAPLKRFITQPMSRS